MESRRRRREDDAKGEEHHPRAAPRPRLAVDEDDRGDDPEGEEDHPEGEDALRARLLPKVAARRVAALREEATAHASRSWLDRTLASVHTVDTATGDAFFAEVKRILESFGLRSRDQMRFHDLFNQAMLPLMYGLDVWPMVARRVLQRLGLEDTNRFVFILTPRRFGKTTAVSMYVAAVMMAIPGMSVAVYSPGQRASGSIMEKVAAYIHNTPGGTERILKSSGEQLYIAPAGVSRALFGRNAVHDPRVSKFFSYPASAKGKRRGQTGRPTHHRTAGRASVPSPPPPSAPRDVRATCTKTKRMARDKSNRYSVSTSPDAVASSGSTHPPSAMRTQGASQVAEHADGAAPLATLAKPAMAAATQRACPSLRQGLLLLLLWFLPPSLRHIADFGGADVGLAATTPLAHALADSREFYGTWTALVYVQVAALVLRVLRHPHTLVRHWLLLTLVAAPLLNAVVAPFPRDDLLQDEPLGAQLWLAPAPGGHEALVSTRLAIATFGIGLLPWRLVWQAVLLVHLVVYLLATRQLATAGVLGTLLYVTVLRLCPADVFCQGDDDADPEDDDDDDGAAPPDGADWRAATAAPAPRAPHRAFELVSEADLQASARDAAHSAVPEDDA